MKTIFTLIKLFTTMKESFILVALLFLFQQSIGQQKHAIEVSNNKFTPDELTIEVGDTVEWTNIEGYHNVNGTQETYPSNPESFGNSPGNGWTYSHVFSTAGTYDYQCNPHVGLGMIGKIMVNDGMMSDSTNYMLTMNFSAMTPHVGQNLWLAVIDKETGKEVARTMDTVSVSFDLNVSGLEMYHSYYVNFYADHNGNGMYDAPPADHAWQMELDSVMSDTALMFTHNTNFTDIMWMNKLIVQFMNMTPHVGQMLSMAVKAAGAEMELDRVTTLIDTSDFMIYVYGIENGMSYNIDFFADFNKNNMYDAPPTDHAWRIELNDVEGDTTVTFTHNTNFTDIMWMNKLTVKFMGMTPHVGQDLWLGVTEKDSGEEIASANVVVEEDFEIEILGIKDSMSYNVDFYADFNENGEYDVPPTDHAWRLELNDVMGDTTLVFTHNTNFTDIFLPTSTNSLSFTGSKMYPNPARDFVILEFDKSKSSPTEIALYDLSGKIQQKTITHNLNDINLNIQKLTRGIYFIEVKTNSDKKVFKLVKQ
ncbi:T9SS type A sorting domain-containing protein [Maribellus maritimus]|uniref:T9SS type A sorting domain-containing protein n=1 Tax=Maribellus maritimus TaxID=2870838 RepID=UPI001EEB0473|nr:T9SS type A sorting domain-containing protein [Maribellus maritimus]MCG6186245.1 T9SS type A sorting domain-containing protein [Maribellus maritimus]